MIKHWLATVFFVFALSNPLMRAYAASEFSFHLFAEPHNMDPQMTMSASGNYLFHALYRGLYRYHDVKGLIPDGARDCKRQGSTVVCALQPDGKWSNGSNITASDYVSAFRRLIDPGMASPQADILFTVKNGRAIWRKEKPASELGVVAEGDHVLKIELEEADPEFEYKLIHPALAPLPPGGYRKKEEALFQITSGPYVMAEWQSGGWIKLKNNINYYVKKSRPMVQMFFVENDATALSMFETKKLSFLRRVAAGEIPRMRRKPGFKQYPVARFDYLGFGPQLENAPEMREALVKSVDFPGFKKLFDTMTPPGCPSLPARFMDRVKCQEFDPKKAQKLMASSPSATPKEYKFSKMGGDDIARAAEWFQGQWKKNLGLKIEIKGEEQSVYLRELRIKPPAIFRKGVSMDRPTCLGAIEIFTKGHPENYIRLDDPEYDKLVTEVGLAKNESDRKVACRKAVEHLLATNRLIPLGEMYFTTMARPDFSGWSLNSLNQLDLTDLKSAKP